MAKTKITWTFKSKNSRHGKFVSNGQEFEIMMSRRLAGFTRAKSAYVWKWEIFSRVGLDTKTHLSGSAFDSPVRTVTKKVQVFGLGL
jgi:hypothetical protein